MTALKVEVGGDAPTDDIIIKLYDGEDVSFIHKTTGRTLSLIGPTPAGGVEIDIKNRTVRRIADKKYWDEFFRASDPARWLIFDFGENEFEVTGGGRAEVTFRPKMIG